MKFLYVSGRRCLDFAGTMKHRNSEREELLTGPRLLRTGATRREGTASRLLATLAADLLDLIAGGDIENVKRCGSPGCTRLYVDSSRGQNRHWCGMGTCGNKAKVQAFRARQRGSAGGVS